MALMNTHWTLLDLLLGGLCTTFAYTITLVDPNNQRHLQCIDNALTLSPAFAYSISSVAHCHTILLESDATEC